MAQFIELKTETGERVLINTDEISYISETGLKFKDNANGYHISNTFDFDYFDYEDIKRQLNP